jgi:hypothetical protein
MTQQKRTGAAAFLCIFTFIAGCTDFGSEVPAAENLLLSVKAAHTHISSSKAAHQNLVITSVKVLLRTADLKRVSSGDSIRLGLSTRLINVSLDGEATPLAAMNVPLDDYRALTITIHAPEDSAQMVDPDFFDSSDGTIRYSLIVRGEYHETPFVYRSSQDATLDMAFDRPMRPSARGQENIILELDPYGWFTVGPLLLDPFNQSKEIDENLKSTFAHVFRDNNRDGEPD